MAKIATVMVDGVADWEIGLVLPAAREWFGDEVVSASIDGQPLDSIGGLRIVPRFALSDLDPLEADLWILPGSERWQAGEIPGLSALLRQRLQHGRPVAAICGATLALGHAGLLERHAHTSNSPGFLQRHLPGYAGQALYRTQPVVSDGGLVTAPGTSPVGFACACLRLLHPEREDAIGQVHAQFVAEFAD